MDSRRVRYLFFLIMLVVAAQTVVCYALAERSIPDPREGRQADLATLPIAALVIFGPIIGPFVLFAFAGLFIFRQMSFALWGLVIAASGYAVFILCVLLCEYDMGLAAIKAAERGSRYMNCAGDPHIVLFVISFPLTAVALMVPAMFEAATVSVRSVFALPRKAKSDVNPVSRTDHPC